MSHPGQIPAEALPVGAFELSHIVQMDANTRLCHTVAATVPTATYGGAGNRAAIATSTSSYAGGVGAAIATSISSYAGGAASENVSQDDCCCCKSLTNVVETRSAGNGINAIALRRRKLGR